MESLTLSTKAKKVLEADYFKALHKRMTLEAKRNVLENEITSVQGQMDGLSTMLGYKPVMNMQANAEDVEGVKGYESED